MAYVSILMLAATF